MVQPNSYRLEPIGVVRQFSRSSPLLSAGGKERLSAPGKSFALVQRFSAGIHHFYVSSPAHTSTRKAVFRPAEPGARGPVLPNIVATANIGHSELPSARLPARGARAVSK